MATFNNGEAGLSVRTKLNNVMQHADGTPSTLTFNDAGADVDVRIEGVGQTHAFFLDAGTSNIGIGTSTASSKLTVAGDANVAGVATAVSMRDSTNRRITSPGGGSYTTATASVTGAIAISLPVGYTNHMMRATIKVFDYATQESFDVVVSGYNQTTGPTWLSCSAHIVGSNASDINYTVRFGFNATTSKCVIYIGELATAWAYPQVNVIDVQIGYTTTGLDAWDEGWAIAFEASAFQNVTQTLSNIRVGSRLIGTGQTTAALTDAGLRGDLLRLSSVGTAGGTGGGIIFTNTQSDTANSVGMAAIKGLLVSGATNTTGHLAFSTRNAATDTNLVERMRVTSDGVLAIGHAAPQTDVRLDLLGNVVIRASTTENSFLEIGKGRSGDGPTFIDLTGDATYSDYGLRILRNSAANGGTSLISRGTGEFQLQTTEGGPLTFRTFNTERAKISAAGNVGIGNTNPTYLLDVGGSARFTGGIEAGQLQGLKDFNWLLDFGADLAGTWRKLVDVVCQNTQYSGVAFKFDVIDHNGNFPGTTAADSIETETYYVTCVRTNDTVLDTPDACYVRGPGNRIRAVKTATGTYEIQIQNETQYREYRVNGQIYAVNGGHTITYQNGTTASTGTAQYAATTSGTIREFLLNPIVSGNVAIRGGTAVPAVALQVGTPASATAAFRANTTFVSIDAGYSSADVYGTAALPSLVIGGDLNTGIFHPAADTLSVSTNSTERLRINSAGAVLIGTTAGRVGNGITPSLQLEATAATGSTIMATRNSADVNPAGLYLAKSRGTALGAVTAVASGDQIGSVSFLAADGTGLIPAAAIIASVDGTPGTNDMPGRLTFLTTADGAATSTERMRIHASGGVSIGNTTDPSATNLSVTGLVSHGLGAVATPSITFTGDLNTGIWSPGADTVAISTGGTERMRVIADGNVSIGWGATPPQKLSILEGNIQLTRTGGAKLFLSDESLTVSVESIPVAATSDLLFKTTNTERTRIDSAGRVLIGTTTSRAVDGTSNPLLQLETIGTATLQSSMSIIRDNTDAFGSIIYLGKSKGSALGSVTAVVANDRLGGISSIGADGTDINNQSAYIMFEVDGTVGTGSVPGRIVFATTAAAGTTSAEAMRIDSAGDVGIGTTNPTAKLEVRGAALGGTAGDSSLVSIFGTTDANVSTLRVFNYRVATGTSHTTSETRIQRRVDSTDMGYIGFSSSNTVFGTGTSTELMRLTDAGRLGIGTTAPAASSVLELSSTTRGFLPPRMTTTERNAISSPATGLVIFNTTTAREEGYDGAQWIPRVPTTPDEDSIINGGFDIWQRGTSSTVAGYGAVDRWFNAYIGGTVTQSRQAFTLGDILGSNAPTYFLRQSVTGQTLASHYAVTVQRLEGVRTYAGQTITILGWAKRATAGNMGVSVDQHFGTGGTPSADVNGNGQLVALTTSWAPFAVTIAVPNITGKTLGTNLNDFIQIAFWSSTGSDNDARSGSLGLQTTDIDLWGIHVRDGVWLPTDANLYHQKDIASELAKCQRYYYRVTAGTATTKRFGAGYALSTVVGQFYIPFPTQMRIAPTALEQTGTAANYAIFNAGTVACSVVPTFGVANETGAIVQAQVAAGLVATAGVAFGSNSVAAAYLGFSAEI